MCISIPSGSNMDPAYTMNLANTGLFCLNVASMAWTSHTVDFRVKRGIPNYCWKDVKAEFVREYEEWFIDKSESVFGYDTFEFDRRTDRMGEKD